MRALYDFIVKVDKYFEDEIKLGGLVLKKDTRFDDFEGRIPYGVIVSTPEKFETPAKVGDLLVFHHHISQEPEKYEVERGVARVSYDPVNYQGQSYAAIDQETGEVKMLGNWIFLKATPDKHEEVTQGGIFLGHRKMEEQMEAEVYCQGAGTEELGLRTNDLVGYSKNSDYRIKLPNGDEVFRMKPDDILYVK